MRAFLGAVAGLLASGALLGPSSVASGPRPTAAIVQSVSGKSLYVLHSGNHRLARLVRGSRVGLGDIVVAGPGARARFALAHLTGLAPSTPLLGVNKWLQPGTPRARDVVEDFSVLAGTLAIHHTLRLTRSGRFVTLLLSP